MNRVVPFTLAAVALAGLVTFSTACSQADGRTNEVTSAPPAIAISPVASVERPIPRFIRATGSLAAEDQAEVAAEIAGRVVATPIERGTPVRIGTELVRVSPAETEAQLKEAEANAAQIEARLGISDSEAFDASAVPEVQNAKAAYELAQNEFTRIKALLDQRVVSQSEFDQRRAQAEAARQQFESAKNGAAQQFQALQAARARVALARKALADTTVRAPFDGLVAERAVAVGDYVTKGMKVAVVVRIRPLRVVLTVPEHLVSSVAVGQTVWLQVDAQPDREFEGKVRYVSPTLEVNRRALTIEAVVPNEQGELKPGLFATARIELPSRSPAVLVPAAAVQSASGANRVYVVHGDRVEERIVTVGQTVDDLVEITKGLAVNEQVATRNLSQLTDGARVTS